MKSGSKPLILRNISRGLDKILQYLRIELMKQSLADSSKRMFKRN